jgi:cysteinyl-tRNA synthetase
VTHEDADARDDDIPERVLALAAARSSAREARDFDQADQIRTELVDLGWTIVDTAEGSTIRRARP